jgi:hypothetical protein
VTRYFPRSTGDCDSAVDGVALADVPEFCALFADEPHPTRTAAPSTADATPIAFVQN